MKYRTREMAGVTMTTQGQKRSEATQVQTLFNTNLEDFVPNP